MDKWDNSCRACLSVHESFSHFLFENISPEIYWYCTSLKILPDELPKAVCDECYDNLTKFSQFKRICIQSQNTLLGYTSNLKTEVEVIKCELENGCDFGNIDVTDDEVNVKSEEYINNCADDGGIYDSQPYSEIKTEDSPRLKNKIKTRHKLKRKNVIKKVKKFEFTCEICNKKFGYKERFEAHKLEHEGKVTSIYCQPCNKTFSTWGGLKRHNECEHTRLTIEDLTCKLCYKVFKSPRTLKIHGSTHEERKIRICDVCGKGFKNDLTLKAHMETHSENRERRYTCQHCGKKFLSKKYCASHMSRRHSNKRYICHHCSYPFTDKSNLAKHLLIHEGKQQMYKCDLCQKNCSSQSSLVTHRRTHTGEKPFACSFCSKCFSNRKTLVDHQRIHTGEKPHKCVVCEQRFTQRGTLKRHMKAHDRIVT